MNDQFTVNNNQTIKLALVFLRLQNGKYVFQRRDAQAPINPDGLGLFGGHMEKGESAEDAAKRELSEETSIDVEGLSVKKIGERLFQPKNEPERRVYYFLAEIDSDNFEIYEGRQAEVYTLSEILKHKDINDRMRNIIKDLVAEDK